MEAALRAEAAAYQMTAQMFPFVTRARAVFRFIRVVPGMPTVTYRGGLAAFRLAALDALNTLGANLGRTVPSWSSS